MSILKPQRGLQLNKNHWAARGLVGCWLMNEGCGDTIFDLSGNSNQGSLQGNTHFICDKFGGALDFDGNGDYISFSTTRRLDTSTKTISLWLKGSLSQSNRRIVAAPSEFSNDYQLISSYGDIILTKGGGSDNSKRTDNSLSDNQWYHVVVTDPGIVAGIIIYVNGVEVSSSVDSTSWDMRSGNFWIGARQDVSNYFDGTIDNIQIWNRVLSASDIAYLYRNPFCMFDEGMQTGRICSPMAYVYLSGSASAKSSAKGWLTLSCRQQEPERFWLRDALFNGMTAESFKLGTVLSYGWFWTRVNGCTALYRGCSAEQIDFDNILTVTGPDAELINPPSHVPHEPDSIYFYVVRRFNRIGYQEKTLAASAKVAIDSNGNLKEPQPNKIYASYAACTEGNKLRIVWYYCPLEQKSPPVRFKIYFDNGSGQIDFVNPLAEIEYRGRMFYSYESPQLQGGQYLFAVRAENADGYENNSQARIQIQLCSQNPNPIEIIELLSCY